MATYLYGLVLGRSAPLAPRDVRGLAEEAVRTIVGTRLAAIAGTIDTLPVAATLENVKMHDAVLQAILEAGVSVAAARFRQTFADDEELRRHVDEHGDRILRTLQEYDGCVEMRVLMRDTDPLSGAPETPIAAAGPGQAYLELLRSRHARVTHLTLAPMLGGVVRAERVSLLPDDRGAVFAHLVDRQRIEEYHETVRTYPALSDATVVGPLAFYSFAEPEP